MGLFYKLTSEEPKFPQDNLTFKELVKFYSVLFFDFDHQDITFREDAIAPKSIDPITYANRFLQMIQQPQAA
jgi:hypothetical protein